MKRFLHIVLVLLAAVACQRTRIIPKDTLADIYTDMFIADQKVRDLGIPRGQMDTTLVYEAVFEKYGYDTDDYLYSVRYYLKDPERFAKVLETVTKRLEEEVNVLDKVIKQRELLASKMDAEYPLVDSLLAPFSKESVFVGLARVARDTSRYPAWFRLVPVHEDTLMISVDSLAARAARDSLRAKAPADSAAVKAGGEGETENTSLKERVKHRPLRLPQEERAIETEELAEEEVFER